MTYSVFHADFHNASRLNAAAASRQTWILCVINFSCVFFLFKKGESSFTFAIK